ncbi:MAG: hypothetical protein OHK0046_17500 [Anaerolineae bacterium]
MQRLNGKVVLVTGGSSNLGSAIAHALAGIICLSDFYIYTHKGARST